LIANGGPNQDVALLHFHLISEIRPLALTIVSQEPQNDPIK
jgi:hypothetical protein